jgi:urocanate hydratase
MGNTIYGQMTKDSVCYIGLKRIIHGTTLTLQTHQESIFINEIWVEWPILTSGLGGVSGAQPKADDISGCISVIAEVMEAAIDKMLSQGWVKEKITDLDQLIHRIKSVNKNK